MQIAILSDIHDAEENLREALKQSRHADLLICCGDLCSPFIVLQLAREFSNPIHIVFGNNDGDLFRMTQLAAKHPHVNMHGEYAELELDGLSFAIQHFDNIGQALARGNLFDVVCFGHNHKFETKQLEKTTLINPGEIYGLRSGNTTFVLLDTGTREVRRMDL